MLVRKRNSYYLIHIPDHNSFTRNSRNDGIRTLVLFHFQGKPSARFDYCPNSFFYCHCSHQHRNWDSFSSMGSFLGLGKFSKILQEHSFVQKVVTSQSKYPVLHQGTFGGTGFLSLGRLGSRANTEKKGSGPIMSNFLGWFFHVLGVKKILNFF